MGALIVLALIGNIWLIAPRRWRRFIFLVEIVLLLCVLVGSPIGLELICKAMVLPLPRDQGDPAAAIVVLGRGPTFRDQRVELAAQLWESGRAPKIFASGMSDATPIVNTLKHRGVLDQDLSGENCSETTEENGLFTSALLQPLTHRKVILITDPPHMLRSFLVFQSFGYLPIPAASAFPTELSLSKNVGFVVREIFGLIKYALTGKFNLRASEDVTPPPAAVVHRIQTWNCRV